MKKFKNPVLISSILSLIFIILNSLEIIQIENTQVEIIINIILMILISLGVINNPEKPLKLKSKYSKKNFEGQDDFS